MEWGISLGYNKRAKSINIKIIRSFTIIIVLTILIIRVFINVSFESAFEKYVDQSNKSEVNHLVFDLKHIYKDGDWDIRTIKALGEDAISKGIALKVYDKDEKLVWSIFEDEKMLSNNILKKINDNMEKVEKGWNDKFKEYKGRIYDDNGKIVGYSYIGHYESTYYMENDMEFFNIMNKFMLFIALIAIVGIVIISLVISKSISSPISKVSKMAKVIESGNYKNKLEYTSNIKEVDELIYSINKLADALNDQEKLRKRLTTDISHELRTPLTSIKGHLDVIIAGIWEPTNERLVSISEEVFRITKLVNDLTNLSKLDIGQDKLEIENVNLAELVKNIVYNYEIEALDKNINIDYELKDIEILIDKKKFSQAIVNLLTNAIKYTTDGGSIYIKTYKDEKYTNISIRDTGIGIPKEDLKYIFERFYRVDTSRNSETGGIGVGLTIAKHVIELHGGFIEVNSDIGKGTEFVIRI